MRGSKSARATLRHALIECAAGPWKHAEEREERISADTGHSSEIVAFEREGGEGVDAVALVLWEREDGYEVTNIVPRDIGELGPHRYNVALRDFVDRIAERAVSRAGFTIEISPPIQGLDDWLPREAADALRRFSASANKSTGSSHPMDRSRWLTFLLAAHRVRRTLDSDKLLRWLTEIEGWPDEKAYDLAVQYEFALDLLDEYDRVRS